MGSLGGAVWRWRSCGGGGGGGERAFRGRGGAGGVQKTVEILQVPFAEVSQIQFIDTVCPPLRDRYPQELQFLGQGC